MRRCISEPTIRFPRPAPRSVATSAFTTPGALTRALTGRRQTMLTSLACRTSRQPEPGRRSTYQNRNAVQTNRATAVFGSGTRSDPDVPRVDIKSLHAKIGELTLENDFLEGALGKAGLLSAKR